MHFYNPHKSNVNIFYRALNEIIAAITFSVKLKYNPQNVDGFKLYLSGQEEYNNFHMDFFNINGDELTASVEETGYKHYTMKLSKTFHIGINFLSFIKELKLSPRLC